MGRIISIGTMLMALVVYSINAATISGTVTNQSNSNAVSGVTIILLTAGTAVTPVDTVASANNGDYTFSNVAQGSYSVIASKTGYVTKTLSATISGTNQNLNLDVALVPVGQAIYGALGGTVTNAVGNTAVSGATVILSQRSGTGPGATEVGIDTTATSTTGKYLFTSVLVGSNFVVNVIAKGFTPQEKNQNMVVENDTTTVNFSLVPLPAGTSRVYGTVKDSASKIALSGAVIILRYGTTSGGGGTASITWANIDTITTIADGWFRFDSLSPNTTQTPYSLVVTKAGYRSYTSGNIVLVAGTTDTNNVLLKLIATSVANTVSNTSVSIASLRINAQGNLVFENGYREGTLTLYTVDGRTIYSQKVEPGVNTLSMPVALNRNGSTLIAVAKGNGFSAVKKLTVCR